LIKKIIKVLIVDDSIIVRDILKKGLSKDPNFEIVGAAPDVYIARDMIVKLKPDVLTLDIEMPRMNGLDFLEKLMPQYPLPVVMVSSLTRKGQKETIRALELGAVDFIPKPEARTENNLDRMIKELITKIKIASTANVSHWKNNRKIQNTNKSSNSILSKKQSKEIIAIGASTGGTEAILSVIKDLPTVMPGILITQHMPKGFTKTFSERLDNLSNLSVKEAEDGDEIIDGRVLIAPGDFHLTVKKDVNGNNIAKCISTDKVNGHRPSVDVMFDSVNENYGDKCTGVILTGMGKDGALGLLKLKNSGSYTIGQDEKSSVVYGMPKVAKDIGAVTLQLPLEKISEKLIRLYSK